MKSGTEEKEPKTSKGEGQDYRVLKGSSDEAGAESQVTKEVLGGFATATVGELLDVHCYCLS